MDLFFRRTRKNHTDTLEYAFKRKVLLFTYNMIFRRDSVVGGFSCGGGVDQQQHGQQQQQQQRCGECPMIWMTRLQNDLQGLSTIKTQSMLLRFAIFIWVGALDDSI